MYGLSGLNAAAIAKKQAKVKAPAAQVKIASAPAASVASSPILISAATLKLTGKVDKNEVSGKVVGSVPYRDMNASQLASEQSRLQTMIAQGKDVKDAKAKLANAQKYAALVTVTPANSGSSGVAASNAAQSAPKATPAVDYAPNEIPVNGSSGSAADLAVVGNNLGLSPAQLKKALKKVKKDRAASGQNAGAVTPAEIAQAASQFTASGSGGNFAPSSAGAAVQQDAIAAGSSDAPASSPNYMLWGSIALLGFALYKKAKAR